MTNANSENKEILTERLQQLSDGIKQLQAERKDLEELSSQGKVSSEQRNSISLKIDVEILQRENELLKIESLLQASAADQPSTLEATKQLIEEKGLKQQVQEYVAARGRGAISKGSGSCSPCVTNCSHCVTATCLTCIGSCTTKCTTGCTTCVSCVQDGVTGNLPSISIK